MGNVILSDNDTRIKQSRLAEIVNTWALNDYDDGINYNNPTTMTGRFLLRKRACCTNQTAMKLAFPHLVKDRTDKTKIVGVTNSSGTAVVALDSTNQPFGVAEDVTFKAYYTPIAFDMPANDTCLFKADNRTLLVNYKVDVHQKSSGNFVNNSTTFSFSGDACSLLYNGTSEATTNVKGFCKHVKEDRQKSYTRDIDVAYGPFLNDVTDNVYTDCNCKNSIVRELENNFDIYTSDQSKGQVTKASQQQVYDEDVKAQYLDIRCAGNMPATAYNDLDKRNFDNMCVLSNVINEINLSGGSIFNNNMTCNFPVKVPDSGTPAPAPAAPQPVVPTLPALPNIPAAGPGSNVGPGSDTGPNAGPQPTTSVDELNIKFEPYKKKTLMIVLIVVTSVSVTAMLIYMIVSIVLAVKHAKQQ